MTIIGENRSYALGERRAAGTGGSLYVTNGSQGYG